MYINIPYKYYIYSNEYYCYKLWDTFYKVYNYQLYIFNINSTLLIY